jgi:hypothetical protein
MPSRRASVVLLHESLPQAASDSRICPDPRKSRNHRTERIDQSV